MAPHRREVTGRKPRVTAASAKRRAKHAEASADQAHNETASDDEASGEQEPTPHLSLCRMRTIGPHRSEDRRPPIRSASSAGITTFRSPCTSKCGPWASARARWRSARAD